MAILPDGRIINIRKENKMLGSDTNKGKVCETKKEKSQILMECIYNLESCIEKAEFILSKINGQDIGTTPENVNTKEFTISYILNQGPDSIDWYKDRINKVLDEINESLF